jgi:hypothetical protein
MAIAIAAWAGCAAACAASRDPVHALLEDMRSAAEARDAGRLASHLSPQFQGSGAMSRDEARATLQRYFAAYESIEVGLDDIQAEGENSVRFLVAFSGRPRKLGGLAGLIPTAAHYRFELTLAREADALAVAAGTWEPVQPKEP